MKKVVLFFAVAAAVALASCGNKMNCYKVTASADSPLGTVSAWVLVWGSQADVDAAVEQQKALDPTANVKYEKVKKSEKDCSGSGLDMPGF